MSTVPEHSRSTSDNADVSRSIAWSIFALAIVAVVIATSIYFAVTFNGPPPEAPPRKIEGIAVAMRTGLQPNEPGPPLSIENRVQPPNLNGRRMDPLASAQLSRLLGAAPGDVIALAGEPPTSANPRPPEEAVFAWRYNKRWRIIREEPPPFFSPWHAATLLAMITVILALALPAWWIARAITRPLRALAIAADRAGTGAPLDPLPDGTREVRALSRAVSTMHVRLAAHAECRTAMLAAIAHDLGTPLSRIAFWIELLPEEARVRAANDIEEMRGMIAASLAFARNDAEPSLRVKVELGSLIDSLVDDMAAAGNNVTVRPGNRIVILGDPSALRRLFANLIDNAVQYGKCAHVDWRTEDDSVIIRVRDMGPGLSGHNSERLFQPFVRGEPSRNRSTGGAGLGLAIARSIATRHGGAVTLTNAAGGGAVARVVLPLVR